jgi:hypothetical protein
MDLGLFLLVLWRHKYIVIAGVILAGGLAYLSLSHRGRPVFQSEAILFVTQRDFPWGRAVEEYVPGDPDTGTPPLPVADPSRLTTLAALYAQLANGDALRRTVASSGLDEESSVEAQAIVDESGTNPLPLVRLTATTSTAAGAVRLAGNSAREFIDFIEFRQDTAQIPQEQRVFVEQLAEPTEAELVDGPSKALPVLVFLGVLAGTVAVAFIAENLRRSFGTTARSSSNGPVEPEEAEAAMAQAGVHSMRHASTADPPAPLSAEHRTERLRARRRNRLPAESDEPSSGSA